LSISPIDISLIFWSIITIHYICKTPVTPQNSTERSLS